MFFPVYFARVGINPSEDVEAAFEDWKVRAADPLSELDDEDRLLALQLVRGQANLMLMMITPGWTQLYASIKVPVIRCQFVLQSK